MGTIVPAPSDSVCRHSREAGRSARGRASCRQGTVPQIPLSQLLPADRSDALLVGRIIPPEGDGPCVVAVRGNELADLTTVAPTMADLLARPSLLHHARAGQALRSWAIDDVGVRLLAPIDLQVVKAAGVTFAVSMIERVIEERSAGDPTKAQEIRSRVQAAIG